MKGLIIKDFLNLKKNLKIFAAITVIYGFMAVTSNDVTFFSAIFMMLFAFLTLSLYSYDDMAKWDIFVQTMPVTKDTIVQSKYLMMILLTLLGALYGGSFTLIMNAFLKPEQLFRGFDSIGAGIAIVILYYCIIIPVITKMGVEKARLIFLAVYAIPFVIVMGWSKLAESRNLVIPDLLIRGAQYFLKNIYYIVPVTIIIALLLSYIISIQIYRKKEL